MKVKLTYFKASGKFYSEGELEVPEKEQPWEACARVRRLLRERKLPGLIENHSAFTVLMHMNEVPHLLHPETDTTKLSDKLEEVEEKLREIRYGLD